VTTVAVTRPVPPRKVATLLIPFAIVLGGFIVGALTAPYLYGVPWGLVAGAGLVIGLRRAGPEVSPLLGLALVGATTAAAVLTAALIPDVSRPLTLSAAIGLGSVWLIPGVASGFLVARRGGVSTGANIAVLWAGAGVLIAPIAVSLGSLEPGEETLGLAPYIVASVVVALVGGAPTVSGATGVRGLGIGAIVLIVTVFAASQVGFSVLQLIENIANISNIPNFWPPNFGWAIGEGEWWWLPSWDFGAPLRASPLIETFRIAIMSSLIGCLVALPVAFMASTVTAPNRLTYLLDKSFMNVIRTIPDLFWAMLFVAGVGIGPLAGVLALFFFSLAIMSKLLSETVDSVDTGPLEAARATGGSHFPAVRVSVLPQVLPNYVAYALYIFEINIRASVVLGLVGAGGIGRVLEAQRSFFRFDRVLALVIVIFVLVFVIEQVSVAFRRRLV
jgi:phosphonate transport system permease protein